ncbi:uroporphyrinogen-III synthase [Novosphingobium sp.]|uniref:uroporphyrinogen-III synthase n=1 Tax=Novosphingobium sp. TaxID=1874826 RepID=UPI0027324FDA|nr:uroporphyrinogen-III synthase [Novosphingobium sp.]MDP3908432.1 uroporphyrinogen-III synthase [Novosphingobium sp.]
MVPLVVIRPQPGCNATVAAAAAAGLDVRSHPLFTIVPCSWQAPDPARFSALLAGSANVFRHGGRGLAALRHLPVYAVGETTAAAARAAGFTVAAVGSGGLQGVIDTQVPAGAHLLRLAGDERVALHLTPGLLMEERVVYASQPVPLPADLADLLRAPAIIAAHSADAVRHLTAQCVSHGIRRAPLRIAALGQRIAAAAGDGWGEVAVAAAPSDQALLALARQMCQDPGPKGR